MSTTKTNARAQILKTPPAERLAYFKKYQTHHPKLTHAFEEVKRATSLATGPRVVILTGPSGVGKSTLGQRLYEHLARRHLEEIKADKGCIPVMWGNAISPLTGGFKWKDFYARLLRRHDKVLAEQKFLLPIQSELFLDDPRFRSIAQCTADVLRWQAEECMRQRKTRYLIIDEAHHMLMVRGADALEHQFEAIKSLTLETDAIIVLCGTYKLLDIRDMSGQLVRRSRIIHFPRYDCLKQVDQTDFASALGCLQDHLPLARVPDLVDDDQYFYLKSASCIGNLKEWLNRSLEYCLETGEPLTRKVTDRTALSNAALRTLYEEAQAGEAKLVDISDNDLVDLATRGIPTPEVAPASTRRKGPRIGIRKAVRDPVGGVYAAR